MKGTTEQRFYFLYGKKNFSIELKNSRYKISPYTENNFDYDDFYEEDQEDFELEDNQDDEDDL